MRARAQDPPRILLIPAENPITIFGMALIRFPLFVSFLLVGLTLACHYGRESAPADKAYLLTRLPWRYEEYIVGGQPIQQPADSLQFRADGTSLLSDGANSAEGSRWEFIDGNRSLLFNRGMKSQTSVEIVELTRTRFRFRGISTDSSGNEAPFEATCVH
jgi:hypothetical protein